ncbi:MAG: insulinase family protein [Gammaproteobacteria bacterium]|nr:insulinase family protein [Gammaproteobacteria bacterium]
MPIVTTRITYHVGSAHEDEDSRGLAHLFEHLMFAKTTNYPERAIYKYVEQFGGSTNAFTSFDETTYYAQTPPRKHYQALEIYADGMTDLELSQDTLDRDKKVVLEELRVGAQNDPFNRLTLDILAKTMNKHPDSISPLGTEQDDGNATLPKCLTF